MNKALLFAAAVLPVLAAPAGAENVVQLVCKCATVAGFPDHTACQAGDDLMMKVDLDAGRAFDLPWPIKRDFPAAITPGSIVIDFGRDGSVVKVERVNGRMTATRAVDADHPENGLGTMTGTCLIARVSPIPAGWR